MMMMMMMMKSGLWMRCGSDVLSLHDFSGAVAEGLAGRGCGRFADGILRHPHAGRTACGCGAPCGTA